MADIEVLRDRGAVDVADVVVVGAGTAAFAAAVCARQQGAQRVSMLEKAPDALIGLFEGNNRGKRAVRVA